MPHKPDTPCSGGCGKLLWGSNSSLPPGQRMCRACRAAERDRRGGRCRTPKRCVVCDVEFWPSHSKGIACSPECGRVARRRTLAARPKPEPRHRCEICGAAYRLSYSGQRTCGRKCGMILKLGRPPAEKIEACKVWIRDCLECGKVFVGRSAKIKACSADCRTNRNRRVSLEWMNANYQQMRERIVATSHVRRARMMDQQVEIVIPQVVYERDKWRCGVCRKRVRRKPRYPRDPDMASLDHIVPIADGGEHSYANTRCSHLRCNLSRGARGGGEQLALM